MKCRRGLMEPIASPENLLAAWRKVRANHGAAGADGVSIPHFERRLDTYLDDLRRRLLEESYYPLPVRKVSIPKKDAGSRLLAIPTVADRVAQRAFVNVLEPIFERIFLDCSHGYRPGRGTDTAARHVQYHLECGRCFVLDADIGNFFDSISLPLLMAALRQYLGDPRVLRVIQMWGETRALEDPLVSRQGTPQGSPISPLLANVYLHSFDQSILGQGLCLVRYADDFVICCPSRPSADAALESAASALEERRLSLHSEKTRIVRPGQPLQFLGYRFRSGSPAGRSSFRTLLGEFLGRPGPCRISVRRSSIGGRKRLP